MPYTFELTFTGLCIFTFKGDKRKPDEVNVLLVAADEHCQHGHGDAPKPDPDVHLPYLSYDPRTVGGMDGLNPEPPHLLVPGPDGAQIALLSLAEKDNLSKKVLEIVLPQTVTAPLCAKWRPDDVKKLPKCPTDEIFGDSTEEEIRDREEWLDWIMALQRMNPETPDPKSNEAPLAGLKDKVAAQIRLTKGDLRANGFLREEGGGYVVWKFKPKDDGEPDGPPHAMAQNVILRVTGIPNNEPVKIFGENLKVSLIPPRNPDNTVTSPLRASITHLPNGEDPPPPPTLLRHHEHYYNLVDFKPPVPKIRLPHHDTGVITSGTSYCPPTTHTPGKDA